MPDSVIAIGTNREVFWDDYLLEDHRAGFRLEEPQKREVVLCLDREWEGKLCGYFHCFFDGTRYRLYYRAANGFDGATGKVALAGKAALISKAASICVLLSEDGVHWERPCLGLVEFNNSKNNNIVFRAAELDNFFVFIDENPACAPTARYKAVTQGPKTMEFPNGGLWAYVSADGFSWAPLADRPIVRDGYFDTLNSCHWNRAAAEYRLYARGFHGNEKTGRFRDIRLHVSRDFLNWDEGKILQYGGAPEEQLYTNGILPYYRAPQISVGFPVRYVERKWEPMFEQLPHRQWRVEKMTRFSEPRLGTALTDGLFMVSRDGLNFFRYGEPFLKPGVFRENNWVYGDCYQSWGLLETGAQSALAENAGAPNEISFFVGENYTSGPVAIRRYTIRQDGFACLCAGGEELRVLTKPFVFAGNALTLNVSTGAAGFVSVEFLNPDMSAIPGFSGESAYKMFGDSLELRALFWRGERAAAEAVVAEAPGKPAAAQTPRNAALRNAASCLSPLEGKPVRVRFTLYQAKLYSMRFVREETL